jgi:succinate dehydrogenase / fumarate reductase, membrane anchor subunit
MAFLTDRKRAVGRGASGTGTGHHWFMMVSSVGLALSVPAFVYIFGAAFGGTHEEVLAVFSRPLPAILTALVLVGGMAHFRKGAQMMIEDYARGTAQKALIIGVILLSHAIVATGLYALARIAL